MQPEIRVALDQLLQQKSLSESDMQKAIGAVMDGRCSETEIASLLTALAVLGESEDELAGAAAAMRDRAPVIQSSRTGLIDTCGTGGDGLHTFNISTATAIVIAAAGVPVAKHGNRSVSSSSGSADVLEALGVNIELAPERAGDCLDAVGLCFCYARTCHTAMRHVAAVRQQLGFRTIFNLLGPLTNPARAEFQLLGASRDTHAAKIAGAIRRLNMSRALIVCGNDQLDEVSLWGTTRVWDVRGDQMHEWTCNAASFGLNECRPEDLRASSSTESAKIIRALLNGETGPARDIVVANAAMGLLCRDEAFDLPSAVEKATNAIESGNAVEILERLIKWTKYV